MAKNVTSINDKKIREYREKVETKRKQLGQPIRPNYITNQLLPLNGNKINLNIINTVADCVGITTNLMVQAIANQKANEVLGTRLAIQLGGYTIDDWVSDIKTRLEIIEWNEEKQKLDAMNQKLNELLSEAAKTSDAIADIANELGL